MKKNEVLSIFTAVLVSIVCLSLGLLLCSAMGLVFPQNTVDQCYICDSLPRIIASLVLLGFMKIAYKDVELGLSGNGFGRGNAAGFLMYLYILENFIEGSTVNARIDIVGVPLHTYFLCFLSTMAIGLFEEVLLRGTILNIMRKYFKQMKYGTYAAVFGSSLLFGIVHMMNYFNGHAYLRPTIAQVFYATFLGVFLGAVYVRGKNLWVVVLLHGLFDFAAEFWELVTPSYSFSKQNMSWEGVKYLIWLYLPLLLAGMYITWREVRQERIGKQPL